MNAQQLHPFDTAPPTPGQTLPATEGDTAKKHTRNVTLKDPDPLPPTPLPLPTAATTTANQLRNRSQAATSPSHNDSNVIASASDASTSCVGQLSTIAASESGPKPLVRRNTGPGGRYLLAEDEEPPVKAWTNRVADILRELYGRYSPSLTLENKGSIARDHLANERTYLAWLRSSLSLITVGVAITQLFRLQNTSSSTGSPTESTPTPEVVKVSELGRPLGGSFIALGIMFLWLGTSRYFHNQSVLSYGQFPASRGSVILATVTVMAVLLACFILVIIQGRNR